MSTSYYRERKRIRRKTKGENMIKVLLLLALGMVILSITYYLVSNHIKLDLKSLFLKGFKKQDNDYGLYA